MVIRWAPLLKIVQIYSSSNIRLYIRWIKANFDQYWIRNTEIIKLKIIVRETGRQFIRKCVEHWTFCWMIEIWFFFFSSKNKQNVYAIVQTDKINNQNETVTLNASISLNNLMKDDETLFHSFRANGQSLRVSLPFFHKSYNITKKVISSWILHSNFRNFKI